LMEPFGLLSSPFSPPLPAAETGGVAGASPGVVTDDDTVGSVAGGAEGGSECSEVAEEDEGEGEKEMIDMDWSIDTLAHLNRCTDFGLGEAQVIHATPRRPTAPAEAEARPASNSATTAAAHGTGNQLPGRYSIPDPPLPLSPSFASRHHDSQHDPKRQWLQDTEDMERGAEAEMEAQQQVDQYWSNPLAMAKLATPLRNQRAMPTARPLIAPSPIPVSHLDEALRTPARSKRPADADSDLGALPIDTGLPTAATTQAVATRPTMITPNSKSSASSDPTHPHSRTYANDESDSTLNSTLGSSVTDARQRHVETATADTEPQSAAVHHSSPIVLNGSFADQVQTRAFPPYCGRHAVPRSLLLRFRPTHPLIL
jgi:hypothetical protein